ncbi:MAG: hypothetical protein P4L53_10265 [Candidatus Obscuribacterales bacterium]|nr:hypothetical protein [Candidatus Obscuribacterales bacterium]
MGKSPTISPLSQRLCSFVLVVALSSVLTDLGMSSATFAAEAAIGESELVTILRATKVVPTESKLTASISGDEVVITTTKKEGSTDDASKIQAVLIAKTVFDSVSNDAQRTKVIFFDFKANTYSEVAVKRAEVKMYGSGQLTEKELLSSLELKRGDADSAEDETVKVAPGPLQPERIIQSARLMKLEKEGSSVKDLKLLFDKVEVTARSGDRAETIAQYRALKTNIDERERAFIEAKEYQKNLAAAQVAKAQALAKHANDVSEKDSGKSKPSLKDLLSGPNGQNMYAFGPNDVPKKGEERHNVIMFYLLEIQQKAKQGINVQASIATMNSAIHSFKTNDSNQLSNCLRELFAQLGAPTREKFSNGVKHQSFPPAPPPH